MNKIFVSSTFRDMQAERDMVRDEVLPELKARARSYGEDISIVDLRWGVDTSGMENDESTQRVLSVCFDEIDKSRPYMLIFLGDRYGWVPENKQIVQDAIDARKAVLDGLDLEQSVTALEIEYGALSEKAGQLDHCVVCFRDPVDQIIGDDKLLRDYVEQNEVGVRKLKELKNKIQKRIGTRLICYSGRWDDRKGSICDFTTSEGKSLGSVLIDEFDKLFHDKWVQNAELPWEEREMLLHKPMYEQYLNEYVGDGEKELAYVWEAFDKNTILGLTGGPGVGKTAILCKMSDVAEKSGVHVFRCFVGNSEKSCSAFDVLKQEVYEVENYLYEIGEFPQVYHFEDDATNDFSYYGWKKRLFDLGRLLFTIGKRVCFFIDDIELLDDDMHKDCLDFMVYPFFGAYKTVFTASDEYVIKLQSVFEAADCIRVENKSDMLCVVGNMLKRNSRNLYTIQDAITKKCRNSLLMAELIVCRLEMCGLQELQKTASSEDITAKLVSVINDIPDDVENCVMHVIGKALERFESTVLQHVVNLIAVSPNGLRIEDILWISEKNNWGIDRLSLSRLIKYLDFLFVERQDGFVEFRHRVYKRSVYKTIENPVCYEESIKSETESLPQNDYLRKKYGVLYAWKYRDFELFRKQNVCACVSQDSMMMYEIKRIVMRQNNFLPEYFDFLAAGRTMRAEAAEETQTIFEFFTGPFLDLFEDNDEENRVVYTMLKWLYRFWYQISETRDDITDIKVCCAWGMKALEKVREYISNGLADAFGALYEAYRLCEMTPVDETNWKLFFKVYSSYGKMVEATYSEQEAQVFFEKAQSIEEKYSAGVIAQELFPCYMWLYGHQFRKENFQAVYMNIDRLLKSLYEARKTCDDPRLLGYIAEIRFWAGEVNSRSAGFALNQAVKDYNSCIEYRLNNFFITHATDEYLKMLETRFALADVLAKIGGNASEEFEAAKRLFDRYLEKGTFDFNALRVYFFEKNARAHMLFYEAVSEMKEGEEVPVPLLNRALQGYQEAIQQLQVFSAEFYGNPEYHRWNFRLAKEAAEIYRLLECDAEADRMLQLAEEAMRTEAGMKKMISLGMEIARARVEREFKYRENPDMADDSEDFLAKIIKLVSGAGSVPDGFKNEDDDGECPFS